MAAKTLKRWLCTPNGMSFLYGMLFAIALLAILVWLQSCTYEINVRVVQPDQLPVTVDSPQQDTRSM